LMAGAYEMLAADYDWTFDDDALAHGRAINLPATARLLRRGSRAKAGVGGGCGTGGDAAGGAGGGVRPGGGRRGRGAGRGGGGPVSAAAAGDPAVAQQVGGSSRSHRRTV